MITIKTIAKKANVSTGTVDRVIHNRGRVAPETERRIKQIIEELNYKPNVFARTLKLQKNFRFGVLMPELSQDSSYWEVPVRGIEKAQSELSGQKVNVVYFHYDKYSKRSFKRVFSRIGESDLDGLLIAPLSSQAFLKCIHHIPATMPYVFFDSRIPDSNFITFIGQDSFQSGVVAAKLMDILCGGQGSIVIFRILPDDYHINSRVQGFLSYFQSNSDFRIYLYDIDGNGSQRIFEKMTKRVIKKHQDLHGIFVTNVCSHKIAEQLKNLRIQNQIHLIGYDLIDQNIRYMKEGIIDFLISQRPEIQGYEGIYALYRYIVLKERVNNEIVMQLDVVTKENVDYYESFSKKKLES